jgi:hypothetical protein
MIVEKYEKSFVKKLDSTKAFFDMTPKKTV